jgi:hypothetical protein
MTTATSIGTQPYPLRGLQRLPVAGASARLTLLPSGAGAVQIVVDGRDVGSFSGSLRECECWVAGWISARITAEATIAELRLIAGPMADHHVGDRWRRPAGRVKEQMTVQKVEPDGLVMNDECTWSIEELGSSGWKKVEES